MPTVTITISESAYREARTWAARHNTSVTAIVQYCINRLTFLPIARKAAVATGRQIKTTTCTPTSEGERMHEIKNEGCETVNSS